MARLDGTGPQGFGPRTGWGRGPCRGYGGYGLRRRGLGSQRAWTQKDEQGALDEEEKMLKEELKAVQEEREALKD